MIELRNLSFGYGPDDSPVLRRVQLTIPKGKFVLVCGPTGSGKSTLLKVINGLVPKFTGGQLTGSILIDGQDVTGTQPHDLAHLIGYVNQQPEGAFVTDTVEEELAYGMEQLGFAPEIMRQRVAWLTERFDLADLLSAPLGFLSGGQQQRVAIGSAIAAGQKILLLDEPTSALDPAAAEATINLLAELIEKDGLTVVLAEHRLDQVIDKADLVIVTHGDGTISSGTSSVIETEPRLGAKVNLHIPRTNLESGSLLSLKDLSVSYSGKVALSPTSCDLKRGLVIAAVGKNGSGKTSLIWATFEAAEQEGIKCAMVPQVAADLLFLNSVAEEFLESDSYAGVPASSTGKLLEKLVGKVDPATHPRDLSAGQQLALALAVQLVKGVDLILMDEPTRGLDELAKQALAKIINSLADEGKAILITSHDSKFLAQVADHTISLEGTE